MDGQDSLNFKKIHRVFVDLDNTLLPFDTLLPVWKAIMAAGLRPHLSKITLHFGIQSIPKSFMASCFTNMPFHEYKAFLFKLAKRYVSDVDSSVKYWSERSVAGKSRIHILTGSFLTLAEGISGHLGWGRAIGTDVEIRSGRLTGKLSTPAIKGEQKVKAIKQIFKLNDHHFRLCAAAGDAYGDRYLLERCSLRYFPKNASKRLIRHFASK